MATKNTWNTRLFSLMVTIFGDKDTFTLKEVYSTCIAPMSYLYPNNNFVEEKLCQTLQNLEEAGIISFTKEGEVVARSEGEGVYQWAI